jgi:hypothetical protein
MYAIVGVLVIATIFGGLVINGNIKLNVGGSPPDPNANQGGTGVGGYKTPCSYPTAKVTTDIAAWDSLDITTARTVNTNVKAIWFRNVNGQWIQVGTGDAADLSLVAADKDTVYLALSEPAGQAFFIDYKTIEAMNPQLKFYAYQDITGDTIKDYVYKVDVTGSTYASSTGKWAMPSTNVYLLTEDTSWAIPAGGQPADIASIGATTVTKYLKWYGEISAEKKAVALSKVTVTVNSTATETFTLLKVNVPGVGYLDGSQFEQDVQATQTVYTYTITNSNLYGADYLTRPVNDKNEFDFTAAMSLTMTSGQVLTASLKVYDLASTGIPGSVTDTVKLSE